MVAQLKVRFGMFIGKRKSWSEKLKNDKGLPKVQEISGKMSKHWGDF
ncbi:MAG: hypothetical protein ACUVTB_04555 [Candidatus Bathycorpusculaceae bacterium]